MTDLPDRLRATGIPACVEWERLTAGYRKPRKFDGRLGGAPLLVAKADAMATALLDECDGERKRGDEYLASWGDSMKRAERAEAELDAIRSLLEADDDTKTCSIRMLAANMASYVTQAREAIAEAEATIATMRQNAVDREGEMAEAQTERDEARELVDLYDSALRSACRKWAVCSDDSVMYPPRIRVAGDGWASVWDEVTHEAEQGGGDA